MNQHRFLAGILTALAVSVFLPVAAHADAEKGSPSVAHIKLSGSLDETPVAPDPLFGLSSENFKSKLQRIEKAKTDSAIQAMYLELSGLSIGWGKLDELSRAIADFRKSGKKVVAYLEAGESKDYLLALACDQIYLPEAGWLMLTGVRMEVTFYKELLDKVGIKADMMQVGDYKGAAEPLTRNSLSPENRKQLQRIVDDYYEKSMVARIVAQRKDKKWTAGQVKELIDQGPFTAQSAVKAGLVDKVIYPDAIETTLKAALKADNIKMVKDYGKQKSEELDLSNPFAILKLLAPQKEAPSKNPKVAVIYAVGTIMTGKGGKDFLSGAIVGSTTMMQAIRQANEDDTVKAIVLRVDSPGGSALASDLIWNALKECKKPVVASMSDVAASGGYYISMAAEKIYAEPGTLTGSIGVVGGKLTFGGLYDKIGLKTEVVSRGANANILSTDKAFSPSEKEKMKSLMKEIYDQFLTKALEGRKKAGKKMTREELEKLAGGRIWTGRQAKENGLIDELGTLEDAIAYAWKKAGMTADTKPELLVLPKPRGFLDSLMETFSEMKASPFSKLQQLPLPEEVTGKLGSAASLFELRHEPTWLVLPYDIKVR